MRRRELVLAIVGKTLSAFAMRLFSLLASLLICFSAQAREIRMASLDYPPFSSPKLQDGGKLVALSRAALQLQGHSLKVDFMPWARVVLAIKRGDYDGALPLWPTDLVELHLRPSRPLAYSEMGFFVRRDSRLQGLPLEALKGLRVGIVRGYAYPKHLLSGGLIAEEAANDISNLRKLAARRFDLVLLEREVGLHLLQEEPLLGQQLTWQGRLHERIPLLIGFRPARGGEDELAKQFDDGLKHLLASGEYLRILQTPAR